MSQAMTVVSSAQSIEPVSEKTVKEYLFGSGTKLTDQQMAMFVNLAVRNNLDPFKREIYAIAFGGQFNVVTGYQVYLKRAEMTGRWNGMSVTATHDASGKLAGAKSVIFRKDWDHPFEWEVSLSEFDKKSGNWRSMPEFMIKKVCLAQSLRLAFPAELSSLPYITEELEHEDQASEAPKAPIKEPQRKSALPPAPVAPIQVVVVEAEPLPPKIAAVPAPPPARDKDGVAYAEYAQPITQEQAALSGCVIAPDGTIQHKPLPAPAAVPEQSAKQEPKRISDAQVKRMWAIARNLGWQDAELKKFLQEKLGVSSSKEILVSHYDSVIAAIERGTGDVA